MSDVIYTQPTYTERAANGGALTEEEQRNLDWAKWFRDRLAEELTQGEVGEAIITLILDRADKVADELRKEFRGPDRGAEA